MVKRHGYAVESGRIAKLWKIGKVTEGFGESYQA